MWSNVSPFRGSVWQHLMGFYLIYFLFISLPFWFKTQLEPSLCIQQNSSLQSRLLNIDSIILHESSLSSILFVIARSHRDWCIICKWMPGRWIDMVARSHLFSMWLTSRSNWEINVAVHLKLAIMNTNEGVLHYWSLRSSDLDFEGN